jgi:serine/threonine-protein kinase
MKLDATQWRRLSALLDTALDLPEAALDRWLAQLVGDDAALRPLLLDMLAARAGAKTGDFLDAPPPFDLGAPASPTALSAGATIGPYRLVRPLGQGGMGEVWLAERADGLLRRPVALKLPLLALSRNTLAARFEREREILAPLSHAHIARLYDAGFAADGQPYLALEFVDGVPITHYADTRKLGITARLALFGQVLEAVAHAHANLVLHRDLKPSNILVTPNGEAKLLDFGIAKLMENGQAGGTELTRMTGQALTLDYASPEQIAGAPLTTAADVYGLGVVLYELLTGVRPYRLKRGTRGELEEAIAAADPLLPSRAPLDAAAAAARGTTRAGLRRQLGGDLDTITLKALRKRASERYSSAAALAEDLQRHRAGHPVLARPDHLGYRFARFVQRHKLPMAAAAAVLTAVVAGSAAALWQADVARDEAYRATAVQDFLISIFRANTRDQPDPAKAREASARELLATGAARLRQDRTLPFAARDKLLAVVALLYNEMGLHDDAAVMARERVDALRQQKSTPPEVLASALLQYAGNLQETPQRGQALPVLREAEGLLVARGQGDTRTAGELYSYLAQQLVYTDGVHAKDYAQRASRILHRTAPGSDELLGALFMQYSTLQASDPVAAEAALREAVELARALHGERHALYGDGVLWLADIEASRLENAAAERHFLIADGIAQRVTEATSYARIQVDLRYGRFLCETGRMAQGVARLQQSLTLAAESHRGTGDGMYVAWAHQNLAYAALLRADPDMAASEVAQALEVQRQSGSDDAVARQLELATDIDLARDDPIGAAAALAEARAIRERTGTATEPGFREGLRLREADLLLRAGDPAQASSRYATIVDAPMPDQLRFLTYRLRAGAALARIALDAGQPDQARAHAVTMIERIHGWGNPPQLEALRRHGERLLASSQAP